MALDAGSKLGPYEIVGMLGRGGMGEVYRALDPRLNREVAIKVSAQQFSERFEREAKIVASLNHPNICHLYDVGPNYLVMELVEGDAPKGPMTLEEVLPIARQIVEALEAAHEKGVTHRDLKPANIKVRPDGMVKVLDFGLAKVGRTATSGSNDATLTIGQTQPGAVLGTPAYMSPEQVRGKEATKRADVWAFGVVLYELLIGERLFQGADLTDVLATVVKIDPDISRAPFEVQRLLKRCLEKDPAKRLRDIGDVWELLEPRRAENPLQAESLPHKAKSNKIPWAITSVAMAAAAGMAWLYFQPAPPAAVIKTTAMMPAGIERLPNSPPAMSPDGKRVVFAGVKNGVRNLWVRDLDSLEARMLPGTEQAIRPFWAPDSRWIGYFEGGSKLKKIDVTGGPSLPVADVTGSGGGSWGANGVIAISAGIGTGISRVPAAGGTFTKVLESPISRAPWFLPDGRHFLYTGTAAGNTEPAIYVGDIDANAEQNAKDARQLFYSESNVAYADPGYILFVRDRTLMAHAFDAAKLELSGDVVPVAEDVDYGAAPTAAQFSVSQNGALVYTSGGAGATSQLTWFDRAGKNLGTVGPPAEMQFATISPDGGTVAFDRRGAAEWDIWLFDLKRAAESRFTFGPKGGNAFPVWSPDGTRIAFNSNRSGNSDIYMRALAGTAQDEPLDSDTLTKRPTDWHGKYILEESNTASATRNDVFTLSPEDKKPVALLHSPFAEGQAKLSPDGRWIAYRSDESGAGEVYVASFPTPTTKTKISTGGGSMPVWSKDGREIYFVGANNKLTAVKIRGAGDKFEAGALEQLFEIKLPPNGRYDVSKEGRFLVPMQRDAGASVPLTIVQNWLSGVK